MKQQPERAWLLGCATMFVGIFLGWAFPTLRPIFLPVGVLVVAGIIGMILGLALAFYEDK